MSIPFPVNLLKPFIAIYLKELVKIPLESLHHALRSTGPLRDLQHCSAGT